MQTILSPCCGRGGKGAGLKELEEEAPFTSEVQGPRKNGNKREPEVCVSDKKKGRKKMIATRTQSILAKKKRKGTPSPYHGKTPRHRAESGRKLLRQIPGARGRGRRREKGGKPRAFPRQRENTLLLEWVLSRKSPILKRKGKKKNVALVGVGPRS